MKKKSIKRNPYSIEDVLTDVIEMIGYEGIEKVINKKKSTIQNISNPTYIERQLDHNDSVKLDIYLKKNGLGNPFLDAHKTLISNMSNFNEEKMSTPIILKNLVNLGETIGDVMEETNKALEDKKISNDEKEKIAIHLKKLEAKISQLKTRLDIGEATDYSLSQKREF